MKTNLAHLDNKIKELEDELRELKKERGVNLKALLTSHHRRSGSQ